MRHISKRIVESGLADGTSAAACAFMRSNPRRSQNTLKMLKLVGKLKSEVQRLFLEVFSEVWSLFLPSYQGLSCLNLSARSSEYRKIEVEDES